MKRVKYLAAALPAAVGLAAPVTAAAATTHASGRTGKAVSLAAAAPCDARIATSPGGTFSAGIIYSRDNGCIGVVVGSLKHHSNAGWWMRIRSYVGGNLTYNRFNKIENVAGNTISWHSAPLHLSVSQVCEALVRSTSPTVVQFGPKCERTGF